MAITPESLKRNLADLASQGANADRSAGEIERTAETRREAVNKRLDLLRGSAIFDVTASDEYQALIAERGQLDMVLAK